LKKFSQVKGLRPVSDFRDLTDRIWAIESIVEHKREEFGERLVLLVALIVESQKLRRMKLNMRNWIFQNLEREWIKDFPEIEFMYL
jgi:hypothetical protein